METNNAIITGIAWFSLLSSGGWIGELDGESKERTNMIINVVYIGSFALLWRLGESWGVVFICGDRAASLRYGNKAPTTYTSGN